MRNKTKIILFIMIIVMLIIMIILSSWKTSKYLIVNVITKSETSDEIKYVSIYPNEKSKKIDKFTSDDFQIYDAEYGCFSSYISNNGVLNRLKKIVLKDSNGNLVENDEIIIGIFQSAEKLKHDIWQFQVFRIRDEYFALVKLNVNWQSPCDFYEYNKDDKTLKLLKRFEGVDIIGLSLPKEG